MPNVSRNKIGARWLARKQAEQNTERVTYARSVASVDVAAIKGRSAHNVEDVSGLLLAVNVDDFIIESADLILDGVAIEPLPGDRITWGDLIFEVSSPGPGIKHFDADDFRINYRIHVKEVGQVP
jgi:hypothetical protein